MRLSNPELETHISKGHLNTFFWSNFLEVRADVTWRREDYYVKLFRGISFPKPKIKYGLIAKKYVDYIMWKDCV